LGIAGGLVAGMLNSTIFSLGAVFAFGIGLPVYQISFFMGTIIISGLVFQYPVGMLSDRYDRNIVLGVVALIVTFCALMITGYTIVDSSGNFIVLGVMSALYGGFAFTVYPVSVAHTHDFFQPDEIIPVSSALLLSFGVGGVTGPMLASVFMASRLGPKGMFVYLAIVGMCYCVAVFWFRAKRPERLVVEQPVPFVVVRSTSPLAAALDPRSEPVDGSQKSEENTGEILH
jgi:MFS family permease